MSRFSRFFKRNASARRTSRKTAIESASPAMFEALEPRLHLSVVSGANIMRSGQVRNYFDVDGTNIKVGVIADGIDCLSTIQGLGEIPDMTGQINTSISGSGDTGTHMLEVIHNSAPGAELYFSSYGSDADDAKAAVTYLINAGCNVIVDDICLMDQPFFELDATWGSEQSFAGWLEDQLSSHPEITYITGAGDFSYDSTAQSSVGGFHYQANFNEGTNGYHNYSATGSLLYSTIVVENGAMLNISLQWSEAFGSSENDFSLLLYDGTDPGTSTLLTSSDNDQDGDDLPLEQIEWENTSGSTQYVYMFIHADEEVDPVELELFGWSDSNGYIDTDNYTKLDSIFGHKALDEVITVGSSSTLTVIDGQLDSTEWTAYDIQEDMAIERSSQSYSTVYNFSEQTVDYIQRLDGIASEGDSVHYDQYSNHTIYFHGTVAAAANVAGIAALLLEINPDLDGEDVQEALQDSAIDLIKYNYSTAGYDNATGYGRFEALSAAYMVYTPEFSFPDPSVPYVTNNPQPYFRGYTPASSLEGSFVRLKEGTVELNTTTSDDGTGYFRVQPRSNKALQDGTHEITYIVAENAFMCDTITAYKTKKVYSNPAPAVSVTVDTVAPSITGYAVNDGEDQRNSLNKIEFTFNDIMSTSNLESALKISWWNGSAWAQQMEGSGYDFEITSFTFNDTTKTATWEIDDSNLGDGHYKIEFLASGIQDRAGNALTGGDYSFNTHRLAGDMDGDMSQTAADIDLLQDIRYGRVTPTVLSQFSLDGDSDVDWDDVNTLVTSIFGTYFGDANLDGIVDDDDLSILSANYGTSPNSGDSAWAYGDFNGNGVVNVSDLGILATNSGLGSSITLVNDFDSDPDNDFDDFFGTPT